MIKNEAILVQKWKQLAAQAVELKAELGKYQLYKTMHEMEKVVTEIGYEIAEKLTGVEHQRPRKDND